MSISPKFLPRGPLGAWAISAACLAGCQSAPPEPGGQPELVSIGVAAVPAPDPGAAVVDHVEVKAVRSGPSAPTHYTINLRGTIERPDGLDDAFGPIGWAVVEAVDQEGNPLDFGTRGHTNADKLKMETAAERFRRVGVSMGRSRGERLAFDLLLNEMDYLPAGFDKLAIRAYALVPEALRIEELSPPPTGEAAAVGDAWSLRVIEIESERQELVLEASDASPAAWPLAVELLDAQGKLLSAGYRRGVETNQGALVSRWRFNQPQISGSDGYRLRVQIADQLNLKQLDAELGRVHLIDLEAK